MSLKNGMIVIRPTRPTYSLEQLVAKITPRNRHGESDWDSPVDRDVVIRACVPAKAPAEIVTDVRERLRVLLGL